MELEFRHIFGAISATSWTIVYVLVIRQAIRDRSYAMPLVAMAANVSWEGIHAFVYPDFVSGQIYVNVIWLALDLVILWTYLRFGRRDWPSALPPQFFYPVVFIILAMSFSIIYTIDLVVPKDLIGVYSAFGQNLLMSALFIALALRRNNRRGQSLPIAAWKLSGTAAASIFVGILFPTNSLLITMFIMIFVLDVAYVVLLSYLPDYEPEVEIYRQTGIDLG